MTTEHGVKQLMITKEVGERWEVDFKGKISMRDMNQLRRLLPIVFTRFKILVTAFGLFLTYILLFSPAAFAAKDTLKVGILHSLSGTIAIRETSLQDMALMAIEQTNAKSGVLVRKRSPTFF